MAKLYTSERADAGRPTSCSGAIQRAVPRWTPRWAQPAPSSAAEDCSSTLEMPKSEMHALPSLLINMLVWGRSRKLVSVILKSKPTYSFDIAVNDGMLVKIQKALRSLLELGRVRALNNMPKKR